MMHGSQKQKKQRRLEKQKTPSEKTGESSQDASTPITTPTSPGGSMPPPSTSHPLEPSKLSKIAIPRLPRDVNAPSGSSSDNNRIAHACEECRHRKTKCSGERPKCKHCINFKLRCVYVDGKRDRARKEFGSMAEKIEEYEKLLKDISLHTDEITRQRITNALQREPSPASEESPEMPISPPQLESLATQRNRMMNEPTGPFGEDRFNARSGSLESIDKIDEDFNRDATIRATGYYGKNSEITWMHRLRQRTEREQEQQEQRDGELDVGRAARPGLWRSVPRRPSDLISISSSTYHCDDLSLSSTDLRVNKFEMPAREVADLLLQCYFDTVHPSFPIICRTTFVSEYKDCFSNPTTASDSWLAVLNLMFAIGAKYAHLIRAEWVGLEGDFLVYLTRARLLGFTGDSILGHASIQHVQISGLMAFFLMSIHQINRSWAISGIAIRHATTLGLNLRNNNTEVKVFDKEMRYRMWWALCFLERQLAVMTGRTPSFSDADCTCPEPFPVDEGNIVNNPSFTLALSERFGRDEKVVSAPPSVQSFSHASPIDGESQPSSQHAALVEKFPPSNGLYFLHLTKLSVFTNEVLSRLYRVSNMDKSWAATQSTMADLAERLEHWRQELPLAFDFTKRVRDQQWIHQRKALGFLYHSTMLIINRPCLCRIDRRVLNESRRAKRFNHATAAKCVHAAIDMLDLLPDEPDPVAMYTQSPWWSLVHHLVEASVVCLLELSFRADHMPHEVDEVFESASKAVHWLWSMSSGDLAASRAWKMCDEMLRKVAPRVGKSVSDMLSSHKQHQQQPPTSMQGLQSSHAQVHAFRPGGQGYSDVVTFQPPVFTTYDQMIAQDPFLQNLLQTSIAGTYPSLYPMAGEGDETVRYVNQAVDAGFLDPNLDQQPWYHQDDEGRKQ